MAEGGIALLTKIGNVASEVLKVAAGIGAFLGIGAVAGAGGAAIGAAGAGAAGAAGAGAAGAAGAGAAGAAVAGLAGVVASGLVAGLSIWWASGQVQKFFKGDFDNASAELPFGLDHLYNALALQGLVPYVPKGTYTQFGPDKHAAGKHQQYLRNQVNQPPSDLNMVDQELGIPLADLREAGQFVRLRTDPAEETNQLLRLIYQAMSMRQPLMPHIAG
jgi:hypothetical protein